MKTDRFKRIKALTVAGFLLATAGLAGCQESAKPAGETTSPQGGQSGNAARLPLTTKGETLSIGTQDFGTDKSVSEDMPVFQAIEKKTGVKIEWQAVQAASYKQTMQTRLAAGTDLPCMINLPGDPVQYANDGLIIPLYDLIQRDTVYMKDYFAKHPETKKQYTAPDGKMYSLPMIARTDMTGADQYNHMVFLLRKDWLQKLGLSAPKTMNDFYNVLKAFKERDPNGNGKQDEVPYEGAGLAGLYPFGWMYGLHLVNDGGIYPDSSGKLVYEWTSPKMKEFLGTMKMWYKDGLFDKAFLSLTFAKEQAQLFNNISGGAAFFSQVPYLGWDAQVQKSTGNADAGFVQIPTPTGPDGDAIIEAGSTPGGGNFAITKGCKNPDLAIKWLDYASYSPDSVLLNLYGIEGSSYVMKDGKPQYTDNIANSSDGIAVELNRIGGQHHQQIPIIATPKDNAVFVGNYSKVQYAPQLLEQLKKAPKVIPVMSTKNEADQLSKLEPDIKTYRDEMIAKFITGDEPLDNFDEYVRKLKDLGIDKVLQINQQKQDRVNSK